ncbi:MAG: hypothetical protein V1813_00515 [Candidatus Aenigmatarchaeota archaeon]
MGMMLEQTYTEFRDACRRNGWPLEGENGETSVARAFAGLSFTASFAFAPDYTARHVGALSKKYGAEPEFAYFSEAFRQGLKG